MTRMTADEQHEHDSFDEESSRSIFSALWFRAVVVILVLGVFAAVAVPYVLDVVSTPPAKPVVARPLSPPAQPAPAPPAPSPPETAMPAASTPPATTTAPPPATVPQPAAAGTRSAPVPSTAPAKPEPVKPEAPGAETPSPATAKASSTKPAPRVAARTPAKAATTTKSAGAPTVTGASGPYWVQVGAFKDASAARRVADKLRAENFNVQESVKRDDAPSALAAPRTSRADRYNVFVSGMAPAELSAKLSAKGLSTERVAGGVMVTPSLQLREAVTLSKGLASDGFRVQVRRAGPATTAGGPAALAAAGGDTFHRVRVGSFSSRAAAQAAAKELRAKGYKGFIARGNL